MISVTYTYTHCTLRCYSTIPEGFQRQGEGIIPFDAGIFTNITVDGDIYANATVADRIENQQHWTVTFGT